MYKREGRDKATGGRPPKIGEAHWEILRTIVAERSTATLAEIAAELKRRVEIDTHAATVRKALRDAGIERVRGAERAPRVKRPVRADDGDTAAQRRWEPDQDYPRSLTDTEWELVRDLFEREGGQGRPALVDHRALVDACGYVVRTGCAPVCRSRLRRCLRPVHRARPWHPRRGGSSAR